MFKKSYKLGTRSNTSAKDKRALAKRLPDTYAEFFAHCPNLVSNKLTGGKSKIYFAQAESSMTPVIIDIDGKVEPIPTVFLLWENPLLLPTIEVVPNASKFMINGADLMWRGVVEPEAVFANI